MGERLVVLIQTNDNRYQTEKLGGRTAQWNRAEWLHSQRGMR